MPRPRLHSLLAALAVSALAHGGLGTAVAGAGDAHGAKSKKKKVTINGSDIASYRFAPNKLTIKKGKTVHWSWNSNADHNVTFSDYKNKHSATAPKVTNFKVTFKKKGTFHYMCTVHGFTGTIVVKKP